MLTSDPAVTSASSVAVGTAYSSDSTHSISGILGIRKCSGRHKEGKTVCECDPCICVCLKLYVYRGYLFLFLYLFWQSEWYPRWITDATVLFYFPSCLSIVHNWLWFSFFLLLAAPPSLSYTLYWNKNVQYHTLKSIRFVLHTDIFEYDILYSVTFLVWAQYWINYCTVCLEWASRNQWKCTFTHFTVTSHVSLYLKK